MCTACWLRRLYNRADIAQAAFGDLLALKSDVVCLMRYRRTPSTSSESKSSFSLLRTIPARKPRTECCCHPVAFMIVSIVAPLIPLSNASTRDWLRVFATPFELPARGNFSALSRVLAGAVLTVIGRDDAFLRAELLSAALRFGFARALDLVIWITIVAERPSRPTTAAPQWPMAGGATILTSLRAAMTGSVPLHSRSKASSFRAILLRSFDFAVGFRCHSGLLGRQAGEHRLTVGIAHVFGLV